MTAQPDGTFTQDISASPERVNESGTWVPLDPTLHRNADGTYSTAATTAALTLSGGGTAPLAAMDDAGKQLAFSWPTALPAPTVSGSRALYTDVLPGVDLSVQANGQGGFTDTIIVNTPEAAENPALSTLALATTSSGVSLSADSAGNVSATDPAGTLIYHAPAPLMWDSTTVTTPIGAKAAVQSDADEDPAVGGPGPGAQVAPVGVQVDAGTMQLTPTSSLLTGDTTTYPVYIDPSYTPIWVPGAQTTGDYTYIQEGYPGTSNWQSNDAYDKDGIGVGYQGYASQTGIERSIYQWQMGTGIDAKTIHSATLNLDETYTASHGCETHSVRAYSVATHINTGTTWNNYHSTGGTLMDTQSIGGAYNSGCAGVFHSAFDVTSALANDTDGMITIELLGDESNRDAFKRFAKTAKLSYTYNTIPAVPTGPAAQPAPQTAPGATTQGCNSTGPWGWIANGGSGGYVTLSGKIGDPDSGAGQLVRGQFALWDDSTAGGATSIISMGYPAGGATGTMDSNADTGWQTSGSTATRRIPVSKLTDGHLYGWQIRSDDGINQSASIAACHFRYDATAPTGVSVNGAGTTTGSCTDGGTLNPAGTADTFTVAATDTGSGLDHFAWTLGAASDLADDGGTRLAPGQTLSVTPSSWGSYFLNIAALDKAGNQSGAVCYTFYVPDNPTAHVTPGDIDGDQYRDYAAIPNDTYTGSLTGLRYYPTNINNASATAASDNTNGPNTDGTWNGALIAHRSTPQRSASGTKTDDMWALSTNDQLYLYWNNINGNGTAAHAGQYYSKDNRTRVPRPACDPAVTTCTQYTADWTHVTQLVAPGDMNGDGIPDLVTKETGNLLWFFPGTTASGQFDSPQLLGSAGWDGYTVIAPGNTAADNGTASLWSRNNASGYLYQYPNATDPATGIITLQPRTQIGTGYSAADYPLIFSVGDINPDADGNGAPDLIATTAAGKLVDQLGTTPTTTEFDGTPGLPAQIGTGGWGAMATAN